MSEDCNIYNYALQRKLLRTDCLFDYYYHFFNWSKIIEGTSKYSKVTHSILIYDLLLVVVRINLLTAHCRAIFRGQ